MRRAGNLLLLAPMLAACAGSGGGSTLADLHDREPDMTEVQVDDSLDQAIVGYRKFLEESPESSLTPEAMRRLADLKLEKEYGILGGGAGIREMPAPRPEASEAPEDAGTDARERPRAPGIADHSESQADFERRASGAEDLSGREADTELDLPGGRQDAAAGPLEAIALYDEILDTYPDYEHSGQVLYQKARALDELGRVDEAIEVIDRLIAEHPGSRHIAEVQFRRAEYFFMRKKYLDAEESYLAIARMGNHSEFYELALYKLGWTFYKQELYEEALHQYVALLDYKVATGYDFDHSRDENEERRIADTFRVISLSFSSLGGPESVKEYFAGNGSRSYEDRVYSHLGEFYLEKLRYADAASSYQTFIELNPLHRASPHFGMRVVEIYEKGGFPKLVLESKKDFAASYGLESEYWRHFDVEEMPEVLDYLRSNLKDLASHYHALYQEEELFEEKPANFEEALRWYRAYLTSFPDDAETPSIHYRLADLLLENEDFGEAARAYEHIAYGYAEHAQSAAAGYAAVFAHRENEKVAEGAARELVRREAVTSTLRFVDTFPAHEHAATVLGAAVDDLYDMEEFEDAIANGRRLIDEYPEAEPKVRRGAWAVVAHASFDLQDYPQAEEAYARVLEMTPEEDENRQGVVDNLAASIYKQGERAAAAEDHRAAADHFLRIAKAAPTSEIRPAAEYDAGAALIRLEAWSEAAAVLDAFREAYPEHELHQEATKQIAHVYRQEGDLSRAAGEYERVAAEAEDPDLQREALLVAGELYEDSEADEEALAVYLRYVEAFPEPVETAVEMRFKVAEMYEAAGDTSSRHDQLRAIVEIDGTAGPERTPRVRYLAARSALVLTEPAWHRFDEVDLVQPFEKSLALKQQRMDEALADFERLLDYEVGEVTAAATYYMAQIYFDFSQSLMKSERPSGLSPDEMLNYEMVLEEEAYPFEERAIEVHQKNLELMDAGVYNAWVEKSLARLAEMMPGRYAKFEASTGWLTSIDTYAYRAPAPPTPPQPESGLAEATPEAGETADVVEAVPAAPTEEGVTEGSEVAPAASAEESIVEASEVAPAPAPADDDVTDDAESTPPAASAEENVSEEPVVAPPAAPADDAVTGGAQATPAAAPIEESVPASSEVAPAAAPAAGDASEEPVVAPPAAPADDAVTGGAEATPPAAPANPEADAPDEEPTEAPTPTGGA